MKQDITNLFVFIDDFCNAADLYINEHLLTPEETSNIKTKDQDNSNEYRRDTYHNTFIPTITMQKF